MKRQLHDIDAILPSSILSVAPRLADALQNINEISGNIDSLLRKKKRIDLALSTEPQLKQKILRLFLRHEYYPATQLVKGHFLVHIEGILLNGNDQHQQQTEAANLGQFFERISLQVAEKKYNQGPQLLEWREEDCPQGATADNFRFKVFSDKPVLTKILLQRTSEAVARYNISDQLRRVLPNMRMDPTEEEVLLAVWKYIEVNALFVQERDKRFFRLDEVSSESE